MEWYIKDVIENGGYLVQKYIDDYGTECWRIGHVIGTTIEPNTNYKGEKDDRYHFHCDIIAEYEEKNNVLIGIRVNDDIVEDERFLDDAHIELVDTTIEEKFNTDIINIIFYANKYLIGLRGNEGKEESKKLLNSKE